MVDGKLNFAWQQPFEVPERVFLNGFPNIEDQDKGSYVSVSSLLCIITVALGEYAGYISERIYIMQDMK